jgi:glycosyltransferase involved in cell wall biosynthesis
MRLLIISHMAHYRRGEQIVGWGPTVQEIDHLAKLFSEIRHVGCLYSVEAPASALPYSSARVSFVPVPPAGGPHGIDKLGILARAPLYVRTILRELPSADVVHVRCPANISLMALLLLHLARRPRLRWVKYAGNWKPQGREPWSYTLQRWLLMRGLHGGVVTVNGHWPDQPEHVHTFLNPCLTEEELSAASRLMGEKQLSTPVRLLYVGRLEEPKGVGRALRILSCLDTRSVPATLDLVGDGPGRPEFERLATTLGVASRARFHGWLPRPALGPIYAQSHLMLFPSRCSEGWPKVLSEAMAYGAVPVASNVSSIPENLARAGVGRTFAPEDLEGFAGAIDWYAKHPEAWQTESARGARAAELSSYTSYLQAVRGVLGLDA